MNAIARLEAANPVSADAFPPPAIELPYVRRRRRSRRPLALVVAAALAGAAVVLAPGTGDEDVLARAVAAVSGPEVVFIEARKVEFGEVVTRELSWTSSDGRRRVLTYLPDGTLESEIVSGPEGVAITRGEEIERLPGAQVSTELSGDPVTLLFRAREGQDGMRVVGEGIERGQRVHLIEARHVLGVVKIAVSAETFLPVSATLGLSTYEYDRIDKLPYDDALFTA